jgi:hypothetical protein
MARMSYAQAACAALDAAMRGDPSVVVVGEDVGRGGIFGQYRGLQPVFGAERVIDTPISESAILGAAVGMALAGLKPVVEMRVVDFALCAIDELVNQAAKARYMFGGQGRAASDRRRRRVRPDARFGEPAVRGHAARSVDVRGRSRGHRRVRTTGNRHPRLARLDGRAAVGPSGRLTLR